MLQIGDQVAGYVLRRALGEGGFGVVYLADDLALGRSVAVKVMAEGSADDVSLRDRFRQEARHAARLDHAHVVPVYAAGEDRGRLYLAMRYVPGEDLSRRLRRTGPVPPAQALDWVLQVGSALDAAHGQRLLHRDVKPANVLLTRDHTGRDHLYLADFGISQALQGTSARLTRAVGTLDYCAPEVFEDAPVDPRTDLYALACLTVGCWSAVHRSRRPRRPASSRATSTATRPRSPRACPASPARSTPSSARPSPSGDRTARRRWRSSRPRSPRRSRGTRVSTGRRRRRGHRQPGTASPGLPRRRSRHAGRRHRRLPARTRASAR